VTMETEHNERFLSHRDILARLVRLETKICLKFEELDRALVLAREMREKERLENREVLEHRLEVLNEHQRRMDKLEATFATKEMLAKTDRLVYAGVGILIAVQIFLQIIHK